MNIKYNQLCIRNAEKKDCEQLAVWWNDGTVMAHAGFPNGLGTSAAEIEKQIADDSDETRRRLIIEYNDVRIGEMSFYVFENHRYEIEIEDSVKSPVHSAENNEYVCDNISNFHNFSSCRYYIRKEKFYSLDLKNGAIRLLANAKTIVAFIRG